MCVHLCCRIFRGPVTQLSTIEGHLVVAAGNRLETHSWTGTGLQVRKQVDWCTALRSGMRVPFSRVRNRPFKQLAGMKWQFAANFGLRVAGLAHTEAGQSCLHRSCAVCTPEHQALGGNTKCCSPCLAS